MRIALVGNWPPPHGGVAVHVAALARELVARGHDVRVLDVGEGSHRDAPVVPARGALPYALALARAAAGRRLLHVHTNGANRKSWIVALLGGRARRPSAPRGVLTIHSGLAPAYLAAGAGRRRLAAAACAGFGRIVAVSEPIATALAACGVPPARIVIFPGFSPALLGRRADPVALAGFRAAHAPVYAAAVAPGPTYGADLLLPAFRAVRARRPSAGLVVFGPGSETHREEGVLALGEIPHPQALGVIAAADVLVRATRADGDALSVREALALGRAVVATRIGGRPPGCLLVPPDDVPALARAMETAATGTPPSPAQAQGPDAFDEILRIYAGLAAARPLPDGGRPPRRAPTF